jgi:putative DNA primase/helicase
LHGPDEVARCAGRFPITTESSALEPPSSNARLEQPAAKLTEGRQYQAVPYSERVAAKAAGAEWDKAAKSWYAGPKADMAKLEQWKPESVPVQQGPAMMPREEFAEALKSVSCVVSGEHPVMGGKKHRITVEGEKFTKNSGSGFYVGHLDGHPGS